MITLEANTIPEAWFQLVYNIFDEGFTYTIDRGSFEGHQRLEYEFVSLKIKKPNTRPLIPEFPVWMNCEPPTSQDYVDQDFAELLDDKNIPEDTVYTYGLYLASQIEEIIKIFKKNKNTNQCCATVGDISSILLNDPPCLKVLDFRILKNQLIMYIYFRSNDLFAGFPSNIAGLQMLKEYMCSEIGCEDGPIYYTSKGLHLYDYQFDIARRRVGR